MAKIKLVEGDCDDRFKCKEEGDSQHECENDDREHGPSSSEKH